jgi:flagellin
MAMVINTNIMSLTSQRSLMNSQSALSTSMERLSTGLRINSAKDDAAGLGIADRMSTQIRGLNQAMRNANDGISLSQTAEGALSESNNILQRMRELAIQSANDINDADARANLQKEVAQLQEELTRIAETTTFNGRSVLDGTLGTFSLQVGSQANETIDVNFGSQSFKAEDLGGNAGGDVVGTASDNDLLTELQAITQADAGTTMTVNSQAVGDLSGAANLGEALDTINSNVSGVEFSAFVEGVGTASAAATGIYRGANLQLDVTLSDGTTQSIVVTDTGSMQEVADKINELGEGVVSASLNDDGALVLRSDDANDIAVANGANAGLAAAYEGQLSINITDSDVESVDIDFGATLTTGGVEGGIGLNERTSSDVTGIAMTTANNLVEGDLILNGVEIGAVTNEATGANLAAAINALSDEHGVVATTDGAGVLTLNSVDGTEVSIEYGENAAATILTDTGLLETNSSETSGSSVADIDISTEAGAQAAIATIDAALQTITNTRGDMGAVQNRLESTIANLSSVSENVSAARSRIQDADFAAETANLTRTQILQQAGVAMLSQANSQPQMVLSLLQ